MAAKETFETGTVLNCRVTFTDPDNNDAEVDPTTVTFDLRRPGESSPTTYTYGTDAEVIKESVGNFLFRLTLSGEGTHRWRWHGETSTKGITIAQSCDATNGG